MAQPINFNSEASVDLLEMYVETCAASANRGRAILIVMITASVLTFVAYWNTQPNAWLTGRLKRADAALRLFDPTTKARLADEAARQKFTDEEIKAGLFDDARELVQTRVIGDRDLMVNFIEVLRGIQLEQVTTLHAPFFGIVFDVNDLAFFAGLTFSVILLWFRFSLLRELINLEATFKEAKKLGAEYRHHCYNLLAMRQVLTVPPMAPPANESPNVSGRGIWSKSPAILFTFPLVAYLLLFLHDLNTIKLAQIVNRTNSLLLVVTSPLFLVFILALTRTCRKLSRRLDEVWAAEAESLRQTDESWREAEAADERGQAPPTDGAPQESPAPAPSAERRQK